jgi:hypothetical protein
MSPSNTPADNSINAHRRRCQKRLGAVPLRAPDQATGLPPCARGWRRCMCFPK